MDDGRRKIRLCILAVLLAAVVIGLLYYLSAPKTPGEEGFLIRDNRDGQCVSVQYEGAGYEREGYERAEQEAEYGL